MKSTVSVYAIGSFGPVLLGTLTFFLTGFLPLGRIVGSLRRIPYSSSPAFGLLLGGREFAFVGAAEGTGFTGAALLGGFVVGAFEVTGALVPSGGLVRLGGRTIFLIVGAEVSEPVGVSVVG